MKKSFILMIVSLVLLPLSVMAQSTETGTVRGFITDADGNSIPGVLVSISGDKLFKDRVATTDDKGLFSLHNLPVGTYTLTATMTGFATIKQENLVVSLGTTSTYRWQLKPSAVAEELVVMATAPLIDTTTVQQGVSFTADEMFKMPTSRDPWAIINLVAGVNMEQTNVGGNKAGTQSRFAGPGVNQYQNAYYIDGVNTTDTAATGASSQYYNFDRFQEFKVSTGGHDPSIQTGGVMVNMVSRSGSNKFEGYVNAFYQNEDMQGENPITYEGSDEQFGNPSNYNKDASVGLSGPIIRDRLWFTVGYHKNEIENYTTLEKDATDYTSLEQYNIKLQWAMTENQTITASYSYDEKVKPNRGGGSTRGPIATWYQSGPGHKETVGHEWFINDNLILETKWGASVAPFTLFPQPGVDMSTMAFYDYRIPYYGNDQGVYRWTESYGYYYDYLRERDQIGTKMTYYNTDLFDASHTMTAGIDISKSWNYANTLNPGGGTMAYYPQSWQDYYGYTGEIWLCRSAAEIAEIRTQAIYVNDTMQKGKWTFNVGFRYDIQEGTIPGGVVQAAGWLQPGFEHEEIFGDVESPALNDVAVWKDFQPRLGVTYDVFGDGKTVLKANYSQYAYVMDTGTFSAASPINFTEIDYGWLDINGDEQWTIDETLTDEILWTTGTTVGGTPIDEDLYAPTINEMMLTFEQGFNMMGSRYAFSAIYINKTSENEVYTRNLNRVLSNWTTEDVTRGEFTFNDVYTYQGPSLPDNVVTNYDGQKRTYNGAIITLNKPMDSNKWSTYLSMAFNDTEDDYDVAELNNPNSYWNSKNASSAGVYGSKFTAKLNFSAQLPWDIYCSSFIRYDSGQLFYSTASVTTGNTTTAFFVENGEYPALLQMDLGIQKRFSFGKQNLTVRIDGFNITNENTVLSYGNTSLTSDSGYLEPTSIIGPRIFRLGFSYDF